MRISTLNQINLLEVNPLENIRSCLEACFCELIGIAGISRDCGFLEAGGTSMDVLHLQFYIQEQFQVELKFATIYQFSTVNLLSLVIQEALGQAVSAEMFTLRESHHPEFVTAFIDTKGVDFLECLEVTKHFHDGADVVYLEWKAWDTTHWLRPQLDAFARQYAQLLSDHCPDAPLILAASCDGAIVALEVARILREARENIELVIIDTRGHCPERLTAVYYWNRWRSYLSSPNSDRWQKLRRHLRLLRSRIMDSRKTSSMKAAPKSAVSWLGGIRLESLEGNLHLIRGLQSQIQTPGDESLGWRQLTLGKFKLHWMEGTHQSMWEEPHSSDLAGLIQGIAHDCIAAAPSRERPPQYS